MNFDQRVMWERLRGGDPGNAGITVGDPGNYYSVATEPERESFRKFTKGLLLERRVMLEFTKSDGSNRIMLCTLSEAHGAKYSVTESANSAAAEGVSKPVKVNNDVQRVWDCEAGAWRSFRWDRLKRIEFLIG